jgi:hypothetical protein
VLHGCVSNSEAFVRPDFSDLRLMLPLLLRCCAAVLLPLLQLENYRRPR